MRKIFATLLSFVFGISLYAQGCDMPLQVIIPGDIDGMSPQNANYIKNIIRNAMTQGDGISSIENTQFGVVVRTDVIDKHIISGAPTKTVLNLNLSLYVGDVVEGNLFSTFSMEVNGIGNNETKAYNNAIRKLNPNNTKLQQFAEQGKKKIIEYYDRNYQNIIKKAQAQASLRNYEEALYHLMAVPECCVGYDRVISEVKIVYKQFVDRQCEENLAQAQAAWMAGYNKEAAAVASVFLSEIYPDACCYADAQQLVAEIKKHMKDEWNFELKQWDDMVSIEKQQMKHAREIAMAFAENQPQQQIHLLYR